MLRFLGLLVTVMILGFAVTANAQNNGNGSGDGDCIPDCQDGDDCLYYRYGNAWDSVFILGLIDVARGGNGGNDGDTGIEGWGVGEGDGDGIPNEIGDGEWGPGDCTED